MFLCAVLFHFWERQRNALPQESWAADASRGTVSGLNDEEEHVGPSRERRAGGSGPAQFLHTNTAVRLHPLSSKRQRVFGGV